MHEADARLALRRMQRNATGLLVAVAVAFAALLALGPADQTWVGYAVAAGEGSLVGGLADWFAVTALFRHPLGLRLPHTAIIRTRKDQFGQTLGRFVQESFLSPANVAERVRAADVGDRVAAWLVRPESGALVAERVAAAAVGVLDLVDDDHIAGLLQEEAGRVAGAVPVAQVAARLVEAATADGHHQAVLDAVLRGAVRFLDEHRTELQQRFEAESPWWLPGALEDRLFDRLIDGARTFLGSVAADPDHEARRSFDAMAADFAARLRSDPALQDRAHRLLDQALVHPDLRTWLGGMWAQARESLRSQSLDPGSELRTRLAALADTAGRRLGSDPALRARIDSGAESAARYVAERHGDEIGRLISATVARWDGAETSDRLELLLGRDLQFIRINGTVVGGLAGTALHALAEVIAR